MVLVFFPPLLCAGRFLELIENSRFAFSCWMREKFLTIDAISFCVHISGREQETVWHTREKENPKPKQKIIVFFFRRSPRFALIPFQCYFLVGLFFSVELPFFGIYSACSTQTF